MTQRFSVALLAVTAAASPALLVAPYAEASQVTTSDDNPLPAKPGELALKVEPGVAIPLTVPQSQLFKVGGLDALYVRTGSLDRPGFAVAAAASMPLGKSRVFWVGSLVRYLQIIQPDRTGFDNHDAKILSLGISLEVGLGVQRKGEAAAAEQPAVNTET
jgi:hypothetical protein